MRKRILYFFSTSGSCCLRLRVCRVAAYTVAKQTDATVHITKTTLQGLGALESIMTLPIAGIFLPSALFDMEHLVYEIEHFDRTALV